MTKGLSGTERREKTKIIGVRVNPVEFADLEARATTAGVSVPGFVRSQVLNEVLTKPRNAAPTLDKKLLSMILGQLGKLGNNLNQIAKRLNEGGSVGADRVAGAMDDFEILRDELLKALLSKDDIQGRSEK